MPSVLRIRDKDGNFISINAIKGEDGKSAYELAVEGGYAGSEEQFMQALASLGGEYALQTVDTSDYDDHIANKNNPHGVTAEQVGALPAIGGVVKNPVLGLGDGIGQVVGGSTYSALVALEKNNGNNNRMLRVINPDLTSYPLSKAVQLNVVKDGKETEYNLYGEHNKPTASDVGAVAKGGDTISNYIKVIAEASPCVYIDTNKSGSRIIKNASNEVDDGIYLLDFADKNSPDDRLALRVCHKVAKTSLADAVGIIIVENENGSYYRIFGEHNKPTKIYDGNGATQTVQVGGTGNVAWLVSSDGLQGFVSANGFMGMNSNGQVSNQNTQYVTFENGVLTLKNGGLCNVAGRTYTCRVL